MRSAFLSLICLSACVSPIVRGEHEYAVTESHYSLAMLPDGKMSLPGWSFSTSGNSTGQPDFGFGHGYGTTDFFIVHGIALHGDETSLPLVELAKRWHADLAVFALHYAHVAIPGRATVSEAKEQQRVPGFQGSSTEFKMRYTWSGGAYDVYAAVIRDPHRSRVVVVMCGNDPGTFNSSVEWSRRLVERIHFEP
jgi:hypothetical protein